MKTTMQLNVYDAATIDEAPWPSTVEGRHLQEYLTPLIKNGSHYFVDNVKAEFKLIVANGFFLPITITDNQYDNSFVCSPYTHYVSYSFSYLDNHLNRYIAPSVKKLMQGFGALLKKGQINKVVIVNNWLFTTNPHPPIDSQTLDDIMETLSHLYPDHAIVFRAITPETAQQCFESLKSHHFDMIASRFVYLIDGKDEETFTTRIFKSDLKLLKDSPYTILEGSSLSSEDIAAIHSLYQALYIHKYSHLNPQFNERFIKHALDTDVLHLKILKLDNTIHGVAGYVCRDNVMISPFFGYDPHGNDHKRVYRILSTLLMLEAHKRQVVFNQSAGGSFYKKIRRAEGHMEYTAVFSEHLPFKRRVAWKLVKALLNSFGMRSMKKY